MYGSGPAGIRSLKELVCSVMAKKNVNFIEIIHDVICGISFKNLKLP
jgi:hypothetical protein